MTSQAQKGAPYKQGIEYHRYFYNDPIREDMLDWGFIGPYIYENLMAFIYRNEGYFATWNEKELRRFCRHYQLTGSHKKAVIDIVDYLIREKVFSQKAFQELGILTSLSIQKYFFYVTKRRKNVIIQKEYLLEGVLDYIISLKNANKKGQASEEEGDTGDLPKDLEGLNVNIKSINVQQHVDIKSNNTIPMPTLNQRREGKGSEAKRSEEFLNEQVHFSPIGDSSGDTRPVLSEDGLNTDNMAENESAQPSVEAHEKKKKSSAKKEKTVDPIRATVIELWEKELSHIPYVQTKEDNQGLYHILRSLTAVVKRELQFTGHYSEDLDITEYRIQLWKRIIRDWRNLSDYYRKQVQFKDIGKNFLNILTQISQKNSITNVEFHETSRTDAEKYI